jgi:hypothetical protein
MLDRIHLCIEHMVSGHMKLLLLVGLMGLWPLMAIGQINPTSVYFKDVPLGTTDSAEVEITVKGNVGTYRFEIEGEGFTAPATFDANFGLNKDHSRGSVWLYFTPTRTGFHSGKISINGYAAGLYGTGDSLVPPPEGVYYVTDLRDKVFLCENELAGRIRLRNLAFSSDTLRLSIDSIPNHVRMDIREFLIAPDSGMEIPYVADSLFEGFSSTPLVISTNGSTKPILRSLFLLSFDQLPRLANNTLKPFSLVDQTQTLHFTNTGGRQLTIELPDLRPPYAWSLPPNQIQLTADQVAYVDIVLTKSVDASIRDTFFARTNASNVADSFAIVLTALPVASAQSHINEHVIARLQDDKVVLTIELPATLTIVDLVGRPLLSTQIDGDYDVSRLSRGVYRVSISQSHAQQSLIYYKR